MKEAKSVNILELLTFSKNNMIFIITGTLVCLVVSAIISLRMPDKYKAEAKLVITSPRFQTELTPETLSVNTCRSLITAPGVIEEVRQLILKRKRGIIDLVEAPTLERAQLHSRLKKIKNLSLAEIRQKLNISPEEALALQALELEDMEGLYYLDGQRFRRLSTESLLRRTQAKVFIESKTNVKVTYSPLLTIAAKMNSPILAKIFTNFWLDTFVDLYAQLTSTETGESAQLIRTKFLESKDNLENSEDKIVEFKRRYNLALMKQHISVLEKKLSEQYKELKSHEHEYYLMVKEREEIRQQLVALTDKEIWTGYLSIIPENESKSMNPSQLTPTQLDLRQRFLGFKNSLLTTDRALLEFMQKYRLSSLRQERAALIEAKNYYTQQLYEAQLNYKGLEKAIGQLKSDLSQEKRVVELEKAVPDEVLWDLLTKGRSRAEAQKIAGLHTINQELNPNYSLLSQSLYDYQAELQRIQAMLEQLKPTIAELDQKLKGVEDRIAEGEILNDQLEFNKTLAYETYGTLSTLYSELEGREKKLYVEIGKQEALIKELRTIISNNKTELKALNDLYEEKSTEFDRLERNYNTYKSSYKILDEKLVQAEIALIKKPIDVKVATRAIKPTKKIGPNRKAVVGTATLAGLGVSILLVYLINIVKFLKESEESDSPDLSS